MNPVLQQVREFAELAHGDQLRKFLPEPYIHHPVRVMQTCAEYTSELSILAAALLHDVLEDTDVKSPELFSFLQSIMPDNDAKNTLTVVEELTDVYVKRDFPQWNRRKRKAKEAERLQTSGYAAQTIKYADIIDNSETIGGAEPDFQKKYLLECRSLLKILTMGHPDLHQRATEVVKNLLTPHINNLRART